MADDVELLDSTDEDEKEAPPPIRPRGGAMTGEDMPPVMPVRNISPPVAPSVSSNAPAPPMPVAHAPQPSLSQAILGSLGEMPHAAQDRYAAMNAQGPPVLHGWKGVLDAIAQGTRGRGIEAAIPGTPGNFNRSLTQAEGNANTEAGLNANSLRQQLEPGKEQSESDLQASEITRNEALANKANQPTADKTENPQQGYANAIREALDAGRDPAKDPHVMAWKQAITDSQKAPNPNEEDKAITDYEQAHGEQDTPGNRDKARDALKTRDRTPRAPTDREEWQKDHPGEPVENYWKAKAQAGAEGKPTADEQRRADLAENLNENLDTLDEIVKRRPELFGPLSGRWAELKQKFGNDDPDLGTLQTIEHQLGMAQISAHGMRSAQGIEGAANSIMNNLHNGPKSILASTQAARNSVSTFTRDVEKKTGGGQGGGEAKGGNLTVDEARDYLQKAGGDKAKARQMAKDDGRKF